MAIVVTPEEARGPEEKGSDAWAEGEEFRKQFPYISSTNYIGDNKEVGRGPQAFLVDISEEHVIDPHFHKVDQFQIFVRGKGTIGKDVLEPVTVHYTDGFSPYGPINCSAEDGGVAFFNLRAHSDVGAHWMPGQRDELLRRAGRHRTAVCEIVDPSDAGFATRVDLFEPEADGLCSFRTVAGPGKSLPDEVAGGAGRYELVLKGTLEVDGETIPEHSVIFAQAGEALPRRRAGDGGVEVLTVQAPL